MIRFPGSLMQDLNGVGLQQASKIRCEDGATSPVISPVTLTKSTTATVARATNVATVTTGSAHGIAVGDTFVVTGCTDTSFDGTFVATSGTTGSTLKYANTGSAKSATADTTGSVYPHKKLTPAAGDLVLILSPSQDLRVAENNVMDGSATTKGYFKVGATNTEIIDCANGDPTYIRPDSATCVVQFRFQRANTVD